MQLSSGDKLGPYETLSLSGKGGRGEAYTRSMLDFLATKAAAQRYRPDASVTPEEACGGRPAPWMCFANMQRLGIYPRSACVKIGDTSSDIQEGIHAGMWTVGVIDSGNAVGLTLAMGRRLGEEERGVHRARAQERLRSAGAHYVVTRLGEPGTTLDEIEEDLAQ